MARQTQNDRGRIRGRARREGGEKGIERERERNGMGMVTRSPGETYLIYRIPSHLAVRSGLYLNYQLHTPQNPSTHGKTVRKICSSDNANDNGKCIGEQEV